MTADPTRILDEIQARADAATEGPWTWAAHTTADGDEWAAFGIDRDDLPTSGVYTTTRPARGAAHAGEATTTCAPASTAR